MNTHAGIERWRRANPMDFEEASAGFVLNHDEAPLRIYVQGDEDEITRACVAEMRCWNCHENFPAPLGAMNWPMWVAARWGNESEPNYQDRKHRVMNNHCPICSAPSAPQLILEEVAAGRAHMAEGPPSEDG